MRKSTICAVALLATAAFTPATHARLAANRLAANRLGPFSAAEGSAAASQLAAAPLSIKRISGNEYLANAESVSGFVATNEGEEVLSFIVSCALPEGTTLDVRLPNGDTLGFFGELGLAPEWLDHPLKKAGRGFVSSCLFARINDQDVPIPISMRGPAKPLATDAGEAASWTLEEGAYYGDYFVAPGEPVQWIACRGRDLAAGAGGGLVDRDCARPDPADPAHTLCGFLYAGDCSAVCEKVAPDGFYRKCQDQVGDESHSDAFRQPITVFGLAP